MESINLKDKRGPRNGIDKKNTDDFLVHQNESRGEKRGLVDAGDLARSTLPLEKAPMWQNVGMRGKDES